MRYQKNKKEKKKYGSGEGTSETTRLVRGGPLVKFKLINIALVEVITDWLDI